MVCVASLMLTEREFFSESFSGLTYKSHSVTVIDGDNFFLWRDMVQLTTALASLILTENFLFDDGYDLTFKSQGIDHIEGQSFFLWRDMVRLTTALVSLILTEIFF